MGLRFYFGASGSGKSTQLHKEIVERSMAEPGTNFLVIVPDQFTMQTQMDLVRAHPKKGIMNIDVLSFGRLSHRILEEVGGDDRTVLDDTGKSLVLRKVAESIEEEMPVIGSNLGKIGYIHEVKSAISEFMQYGIGVKELEELTEYAKKRGALYHKLKDLGVLYRHFLQYINEKYVTTEETLDLLCRLLPKSGLIRSSVVAFDGFTGFTPIQNRLIQSIMELSREVIVTVVMDSAEKNPYVPDGEQKLFYLSKKTTADLCRLAKDSGVPRGGDVFVGQQPDAEKEAAGADAEEGGLPRFRGNRELQHLERYLFRYPVQAYQGAESGCQEGNVSVQDEVSLVKAGSAQNAASSGETVSMQAAGSAEKTDSGSGAASEGYSAIHLSEASSPEEEIRQVCIRIRELVQEKHYCYRDFAVVTGDLASYAGHVEAEAEKFGIPVFLDRTKGILLNPFIEYIRSALKIVMENFSYRSVFHYLRSGLTGFDREETDLLENYVLAYGIKGRYRWERMFTARLPEMGTEELERLNGMRLAFLDELAPLLEKGADTAGGKIRALYAFIIKNKVQEKLAVYERMFQAQGGMGKAAVRAREYGQIYRLVMDLLDQMDSLLSGEMMEMKEFADILDAGFGEIEVGTIPQNVDRVVVGDIERTRLKEIKVLFFVGINDGSIPKNAGFGGIISDIDREFLQESPYELAPTPRQQMYIQRLYLYMNMTKPSQQLYLSYSKVNNEGKSIRPAYLVDTLRKLFPGLRTGRPEMRDFAEQIKTKRSGMDYLADMMRDYAAGDMEEAGRTRFFTVYHIYRKDGEYRKEVKRLTDAAFARYREHPLGKEIAGLLYGRMLVSSVSRLEQYASCAYAHFLRYGLSLKEREEYGFEAVDMGNVFHGVLELFAGKLQEGGHSWFDFSEETAEGLLRSALDAYAAAYGETVLYSTARNEYAIERMHRILKRAVLTLQYQLKKGSFIPRHFEMSFTEVENLESVNIALSQKERMKLRGRIDRIDTMEDEEHVYVKVIDYKSGNKKFDLAAIYYGLQLQLVVYMNAALELERKKQGGKEVIPAALLYYHVADPMVKTDEAITPEELNEQLLRELRMTGVVNKNDRIITSLDGDFADKSDIVPVERKKDGDFSVRSGVMEAEDLQEVSAYVNRKIKEIGREILDGRIAAAPCRQGTETACDYCSFRPVCGFDGRIEGYGYRKLEELSKDEVLERMKMESDGLS